MNRTELIDAVSVGTGLTRQQAEAAIDAVVYEVTAGVKAGNPVRITGFGTFKLRERQARKGRNPQTGAPVKIKASKGIGFTPGVRLRADLNARGAVAKPKTSLGAVSRPSSSRKMAAAVAPSPGRRRATPVAKGVVAGKATSAVSQPVTKATAARKVGARARG